VNQSLPAHLVCVVILGLSLAGVACAPKQAPAPDPAALLQAVTPADPGKYEHVADMRHWRNPYLVLRTEGVGLLDIADNAEILLKPDEMLAALAHLPASAWPYGRVVAISENGPKNSEQDKVAVRRNKGIVGGILEGAHVAIKWVPSA
jgi:hypothetical protein